MSFRNPLLSVVLIGGYDLLGELVNLTCFSWLPSASAALVIVNLSIRSGRERMQVLILEDETKATVNL